MADDDVNGELTYIGRREATDGTVYHAYIAGDRPDEVSLFKKAVTGTNVGATYSIKMQRSDDGALAVHGRGTYLRTDKNDPRFAGWLAEHAAVVTAEAAEKRERGDKATLGDLTLSQVRDNYRRLPTPLRRALLANVLDYLK